MHKIAIVEDDHAILEMYKLKFEFANYSVVTAVNGKLGLEIIKDEKPDIILLDLMMPEMTGDEMLAELRKQVWGAHIPVVILTNVSLDEAPKNLKKLGVAGYIVKANTTPQLVLEQVQAILA